jgi:3-hydroxyacyl-CoA dehydrogenase
MKGKVTCYGGGLIGSGWATIFILKGLTTYIYDFNRFALQTS